MSAGSWEDSSNLTHDRDEKSNLELVKKRPPPRPSGPPPRPSAPPRPAPINLKATSRSTSPSAQATPPSASASPSVGHHITSANKKAHKIITSLKHKAGLKSPKHFIKDKKKNKSPIPSPSKEFVEPSLSDKTERSEEWLALQQMLERTKETVIKTKQNLNRLASKDESDNQQEENDEASASDSSWAGWRAKQDESEEIDEETSNYTSIPYSQTSSYYPEDSTDKSPDQDIDAKEKSDTGGSVQDLLGLGLGDFESPPEPDDWLSNHQSQFEKDFLAAEEENLTASNKSVTDELVDSFLGLDPSTSLKPSPAISPALSPVTQLAPESEVDPFVVPKIIDPFDVSLIVIKTESESDPFTVKSAVATPSDPFVVTHDPFVTPVDGDIKSTDPFVVNPTKPASPSTDPFVVSSDPVTTTPSYNVLEDPFSLKSNVPRTTPDSLTTNPQSIFSSSDPFVVSPACTESLFLGSTLGSSVSDSLAVSPGLPKSGSELFGEGSDLTTSNIDPFTPTKDIFSSTVDLFAPVAEPTSSTTDLFASAVELKSSTVDPFSSTAELTSSTVDPFGELNSLTSDPFTSTAELSGSKVDSFTPAAEFTTSNIDLFGESGNAFEIESNKQETKIIDFVSEKSETENQIDDFFIEKPGLENAGDNIFMNNITKDQELGASAVDPFASSEASSLFTQPNLELSNFASFSESEGFIDPFGSTDTSLIPNQTDKLASTPEPFSTISEPLDFASIALAVKAAERIAVSSAQSKPTTSSFTTISEPLDFHTDDNSYKLDEKNTETLESNPFCTTSEPVDVGSVSFVKQEDLPIADQVVDKIISSQTDPFTTISEPVDVQVESFDTPGWNAFSEQFSSTSDSDLNTKTSDFAFSEFNATQAIPATEPFSSIPFETNWPSSSSDSVVKTDLAFPEVGSNFCSANMSEDAFPIATDAAAATFTAQSTDIIMTTITTTAPSTTTKDSSLLTMEVTDLAAGGEETDTSLTKTSADFLISDEAFSTTFGNQVSSNITTEILAQDMSHSTNTNQTFSLIDDSFASTPPMLNPSGENLHSLTDPFAEDTFIQSGEKLSSSFSDSGFPTTNSAFPMLEPSAVPTTAPFPESSFSILAPQTTPVPSSFSAMDSQEVPDISKPETSQINPFDNIDPEASIHLNVKNPFSMFETIEDDSPFGQSVDNNKTSMLIQPEISEDIASKLNAFLQSDIAPDPVPVASSPNVASSSAEGADSNISLFTEASANPFVDQNDTPAVATAEFFDEDFFNTKTAEKIAEGDSVKNAWGAMESLDKDSAFNPFQGDNFDAENIPQNILDDMDSQEPTNDIKNPFLSSDFNATAMIGETTINPFLSQVEELEKAQSSLSDNLSLFLGKGENLPIDPTDLPIDVFDPFKTIEPDDIPEASGGIAVTHTAAVDSSDDDKESPDMDDNKDAFKLTIRMREPVESGPSVALPPPPKVPKSPQMAPRINPFDRDSPPEENFAKFEVMETEDKVKEPRTETQMSVSTTESSTPEEEEKHLEPLESFNPKMEEEGWTLMLRQPTKKKLTGNRFWKTIFVRLVQQNDGPVLKLYNSKDDKDSFQELPLQPCYSLSEIALQHYDQYGKIHTLKIQYVFYRERVGIRTEKITPTFVKNMKPKANMILDHAPQISELLKFGSLNEQTIISFVQEVEDALMGIVAHREKTLSYQKDEVIVDVIDEYRAEINTTGHIVNQKARVRIFCLSFVTGMPFVELGVNDKRRKGREVVGRHDIIPIKTEEWIKPENIQFHCSAKPEEYEKDGTIKFHPLDACHFELMRFRVRLRDNRELPLIVRVFRSIKERHVEYRCDVVCTGYHAYSKKHGQFPCEDIEIRFPIPDCWIYLFRYEKRFGYGSFKSATRKPGKIKGLERLTMMTQSSSNPALLEASVGTAKYENVFHAIVWRISRLPERNQGAYKTHLFTLRLDLGPHDEIPDSLEMVSDVKFTMPASTISKCQIRSISCGNPTPPEKWVRYIAHYNYKVAIEHNLEGNIKNIPEIDVHVAEANDSESDS